jgi:hypothetical protein
MLLDWVSFGDVYEPDSGPFKTSLTNMTYTQHDIQGETYTCVVLRVTFVRVRSASIGYPYSQGLPAESGPTRDIVDYTKPHGGHNVVWTILGQ